MAIGVVDIAGNRVATYENSDYGEPLDAESAGLTYKHNRYYQASTGRFIQRDPVSYADGLNLYSYCAGDPIKASDPDGLLPEELPGSYAERRAQWASDKPEAAKAQIDATQLILMVTPVGWVVNGGIDTVQGDRPGPTQPIFMSGPGGGPYWREGGHHPHNQAAFKDQSLYSGGRAFSIDQQAMKKMGFNHLPHPERTLR